jgi:hypothetical protein
LAAISRRRRRGIPRTLAALDMDGLRYTLALYQLGG